MACPLRRCGVWCANETSQSHCNKTKRAEVFTNMPGMCICQASIGGLGLEGEGEVVNRVWDLLLVEGSATLTLSIQRNCESLRSSHIELKAYLHRHVGRVQLQFVFRNNHWGPVVASKIDRVCQGLGECQHKTLRLSGGQQKVGQLHGLAGCQGLRACSSVI